MPKFEDLEENLGIEFKNKELLVQAFCHRSYLNEHPDFLLPHNERLEFLGDAVIELVVTEYLFLKFPEKEEGILTAWRASLVNSKTLSKIAQDLDFGKYLLLSKGEEKEAEKKSKSYLEILANTFEAFVGALYLDKGYKACRNFLYKHLIKELPSIIENKAFIDAKSRFQEVAQEKLKITPTYRILKEWGPDHNKHFIAGVYLDDKLIAKGEGSSKQEAEEEAAKKALKKKGWE
ncbi:MAG: ribonuclease III [Candidatus Pacebacteria bacterium]|nr:ribonuclease III [Candidatus Paceibacterota bacterium]